MPRLKSKLRSERVKVQMAGRRTVVAVPQHLAEERCTRTLAILCLTKFVYVCEICLITLSMTVVTLFN